MSVNLQKKRGIESRRRRATFAANSSEYESTTSSQVRIEINVDKETIDFETGYLMFELSAAGDAGSNNTLDSVPWDASAWIRDLRIFDKAGREIGEQVRHYNAFARKHFEMLGNDGCNGTENYLGRMEGASGRTGTQLALSKYERAHKFVTHVFAVETYFPAHLVSGLIIEIDMADAGDVLQCSAAGGSITSYTVSNVRYVCDLVLLKPDSEAELRSQLQNGLEIHYESPMNHNQAIVAAGTQQRFDLGVASGKIKSVQAFMILNTQQDGVEDDSFGVFSQNDLSGYRTKLGSEWLTEREIKVSDTKEVEYLVEYLKSMNLQSSDITTFYGDSSLGNGNGLGDRFVIGQKVEVSKDPDVASGRRDFQSNKVELELNFNGTGNVQPYAATLYTNIMLEKSLVMLPGRQFRNKD